MVQEQAPQLHNQVPSHVFKGNELIEEFNQIKAEAQVGASPALINRRYAAWEKRAEEALQ